MVRLDVLSVLLTIAALSVPVSAARVISHSGESFNSAQAWSVTSSDETVIAVDTCRFRGTFSVVGTGSMLGLRVTISNSIFERDFVFSPALGAGSMVLLQNNTFESHATIGSSAAASNISLISNRMKTVLFNRASLSQQSRLLLMGNTIIVTNGSSVKALDFQGSPVTTGSSHEYVANTISSMLGSAAAVDYGLGSLVSAGSTVIFRDGNVFVAPGVQFSLNVRLSGGQLRLDHTTRLNAFAQVVVTTSGGPGGVDFTLANSTLYRLSIQVSEQLEASRIAVDSCAFTDSLEIYSVSGTFVNSSIELRNVEQRAGKLLISAKQVAVNATIVLESVATSSTEVTIDVSMSDASRFTVRRCFFAGRVLVDGMMWASAIVISNSTFDVELRFATGGLADKALIDIDSVVIRKWLIFSAFPIRNSTIAVRDTQIISGMRPSCSVNCFFESIQFATSSRISDGSRVTFRRCHVSSMRDGLLSLSSSSPLLGGSVLELYENTFITTYADVDGVSVNMDTGGMIWLDASNVLSAGLYVRSSNVLEHSHLAVANAALSRVYVNGANGIANTTISFSNTTVSASFLVSTRTGSLTSISLDNVSFADGPVAITFQTLNLSSITFDAVTDVKPHENAITARWYNSSLCVTKSTFLRGFKLDTGSGTVASRFTFDENVMSESVTVAGNLERSTLVFSRNVALSLLFSYVPLAASTVVVRGNHLGATTAALTQAAIRFMSGSIARDSVVIIDSNHLNTTRSTQHGGILVDDTSRPVSGSAMRITNNTIATRPLVATISVVLGGGNLTIAPSNVIIGGIVSISTAALNMTCKGIHIHIANSALHRLTFSGASATVRFDELTLLVENTTVGDSFDIYIGGGIAASALSLRNVTISGPIYRVSIRNTAFFESGSLLLLENVRVTSTTTQILHDFDTRRASKIVIRDCEFNSSLWHTGSISEGSSLSVQGLVSSESVRINGDISQNSSVSFANCDLKSGVRFADTPLTLESSIILSNNHIDSGRQSIPACSTDCLGKSVDFTSGSTVATGSVVVMDSNVFSSALFHGVRMASSILLTGRVVVTNNTFDVRTAPNWAFGVNLIGGQVYFAENNRIIAGAVSITASALVVNSTVAIVQATVLSQLTISLTAGARRSNITVRGVESAASFINIQGKFLNESAVSIESVNLTASFNAALRIIFSQGLSRSLIDVRSTWFRRPDAAIALIDGGAAISNASIILADNSWGVLPLISIQCKESTHSWISFIRNDAVELQLIGHHKSASVVNVENNTLVSVRLLNMPLSGGAILSVSGNTIVQDTLSRTVSAVSSPIGSGAIHQWHGNVLRRKPISSGPDGGEALWYDPSSLLGFDGTIRFVGNDIDTGSRSTTMPVALALSTQSLAESAVIEVAGNVIRNGRTLISAHVAKNVAVVGNQFDVRGSQSITFSATSSSRRISACNTRLGGTAPYNFSISGFVELPCATTSTYDRCPADPAASVTTLPAVASCGLLDPPRSWVVEEVSAALFVAEAQKALEKVDVSAAVVDTPTVAMNVALPQLPSMLCGVVGEIPLPPGEANATETGALKSRSQTKSVSDPRSKTLQFYTTPTASYSYTLTGDGITRSGTLNKRSSSPLVSLTRSTSPTAEPLSTPTPNTSPPPSAPPGRITMTVILDEVLGDRASAEAVQATATASTAISALVATPTMATQASRIASVLGALDCNFDENDASPSVVEHPIQPSQSIGREGPVGRTAAALLCTTALVGFFVAAHLLLWLRIDRTTHLPEASGADELLENLLGLSTSMTEMPPIEVLTAKRRRPRSQRQQLAAKHAAFTQTLPVRLLRFSSVIAVIFLTYFAPSIAGAATFVLVHSRDVAASISAAICFGLLAATLGFFAWRIARHFNCVALDKTKVEGSSRGSAATGDSDDDDEGGRDAGSPWFHRDPVRKLGYISSAFAPELSLGVAAPNSPGTAPQSIPSSSFTNNSSLISRDAEVLNFSFASFAGAGNASFALGAVLVSAQAARERSVAFVEALSPLFDGSGAPGSLPRRLYYFEDVISACLMAAVSNAKAGGSCEPIAWVVTGVATVHLVYLVYFRPFRVLLDSLFSVIFAGIQVGLGALTIIAVHASDSLSDEGAHRLRLVIAYLSLAQAAFFYAQVAVQASFTYWLHRRRLLVAELHQQQQETASRGRGGHSTVRVGDRIASTRPPPPPSPPSLVTSHQSRLRVPSIAKNPLIQTARPSRRPADDPDL